MKLILATITHTRQKKTKIKNESLNREHASQFKQINKQTTNKHRRIYPLASTTKPLIEKRRTKKEEKKKLETPLI